MKVEIYILYFFMIMAGGSALAILFTRNVFKAALLLLGCLLSIAGIYVLLNAAFIAVTQILIYAGGVVVVIIFGIMLTTRISGKPLVVQSGNVFSGSLAGLGLFITMVLLFQTAAFRPTTESIGEDSLSRIGIHLMSDFVLPFEVAGVLLLIALVGAAVTASIIKQNK